MKQVEEKKERKKTVFHFSSFVFRGKEADRFKSFIITSWS